MIGELAFADKKVMDIWGITIAAGRKPRDKTFSRGNEGLCSGRLSQSCEKASGPQRDARQSKERRAPPALSPVAVLLPSQPCLELSLDCVRPGVKLNRNLFSKCLSYFFGEEKKKK